MSFRARQPRPPHCEPDTMRADQRCQGTNGPAAGRISRSDASRRRHDRPRRPPRESDQGPTPRDSGGAGPGLGPDGAIPRCARNFRITAGSCSVAISRSRPPHCGHARTSIENARCRGPPSSRRANRSLPVRPPNLLCRSRTPSACLPERSLSPSRSAINSRSFSGQSAGPCRGGIGSSGSGSPTCGPAGAPAGPPDWVLVMDSSTLLWNSTREFSPLDNAFPLDHARAPRKLQQPSRRQPAGPEGKQWGLRALASP
jgi:hypothetical protein